MLILLRLLFCFTLSLSEQQKCSYNGITTKPGYVHTYICIAVCIYIQTSKRIYSYWAVSIILEWNKSNKKKIFRISNSRHIPSQHRKLNSSSHFYLLPTCTAIFLTCSPPVLREAPVPFELNSCSHGSISLSLLRSLLLCYTITLCWLASLIQKPTEWSI